MYNVLTAEICFILWMGLYYFCRVGSHTRTSWIRADLILSFPVLSFAAPRDLISINSGTSVMDSVVIDEGEHTVATGPRACGGGGGSCGGGSCGGCTSSCGGGTTIRAGGRPVSEGSEGESVLVDDSGVVRQVHHPSSSLGDGVVHRGVGVVVDPGGVTCSSVGQDSSVPS